MSRRPPLSVLSLVLGLAPTAVALAAPVGTGQPEHLYFADDGVIPNSRLPVPLYRQVPLEGTDRAAALERLFADNAWPPQWRYGVYDYQHYHPNAHEALGVARGQARLRLGGEQGQDVAVTAGDVVVLPAGTGHRNLESSADFLVVGAYPPDQQDFITQRADPAAHARSVELIAQVPLPTSDPVSGREGALPTLWR
ncbi:cupin domain-containing protein [Pseudomonas benzopyrenica]|uniref:cupin domain-containing protein n=1 Tax=Pseudomonas benzopyrenica TaxID=2993566 RepID=UPI00227E1C30|nr:cupin domain-containing protein [Pseudomonas benzopyrenica]MDC7831302.1 cupin domain-containing protein [Pseudomonas benzopyrenica]